MTDPLGQSQVIPYLKGLSLEGYKITLVSFEKNSRLGFQDAIARDLEAAGIEWAPMLYTDRPPILSTLLDLNKMHRKVNELHLLRKFKLVHCRSYIASFVGLHLNKKYGVPFLFDMRGFYPDERVDGNIWNLRNPVYNLIYRYFKKKEKAFLNNADHIVSLTENGKRVMQEEWQIQTPISVIPCCADTDLFQPSQDKEAIKKELGFKESDFILSYLGSIGTWYMLSEMLDFFKILLIHKPHAKFFFITPDNPKVILKEVDDRKIPRETIVIKSATRIEVPKCATISDYSIFFIKPVFSKKASSPTKQGELMSLGVPVICNSGVGDTDLIIEKYGAGFLIDLDQRVDIENVIKKLSTKFDRKMLRHGAMEYFGLKKGVESYFEIYSQLCKTHH
ncbi:MAG: glycosyltransferase [Flavobacteriaceae bacterium]|nr:glycosyltransferase [Flavobacteriaceae bacterium]